MLFLKINSAASIKQMLPLRICSSTSKIWNPRECNYPSTWEMPTTWIQPNWHIFYQPARFIIYWIIMQAIFLTPEKDDNLLKIGKGDYSQVTNRTLSIGEVYGDLLFSQPNFKYDPEKGKWFDEKQNFWQNDKLKYLYRLNIFTPFRFFTEIATSSNLVDILVTKLFVEKFRRVFTFGRASQTACVQTGARHSKKNCIVSKNTYYALDSVLMDLPKYVENFGIEQNAGEQEQQNAGEQETTKMLASKNNKMLASPKIMKIFKTNLESRFLSVKRPSCWFLCRHVGSPVSAFIRHDMTVRFDFDELDVFVLLEKFKHRLNQISMFGRLPLCSQPSVFSSTCKDIWDSNRWSTDYQCAHVPRWFSGGADAPWPEK